MQHTFPRQRLRFVVLMGVNVITTAFRDMTIRG